MKNWHWLMMAAVAFFGFTAMLSGCASSGGSSASPSNGKQVRLPSSLSTVVPAPAKGGLWYLQGNKPVVVEDEHAFPQASIGEFFKPSNLFTATNVFSYTVVGMHSFLQLGPTQRTFYTRHDPAGMGIHRFSLYPEDQRRYITMVNRVGSSEFFPKNESDDIAYTYTRLANDIYKITITDTLSPGEYGIFACPGPDGKKYSVFYTFSIAP